nr:MAG TPA: hypothetical protein [Bacteriophage sp.]
MPCVVVLSWGRGIVVGLSWVFPWFCNVIGFTP